MKKITISTTAVESCSARKGIAGYDMLFLMIRQPSIFLQCHVVFIHCKVPSAGSALGTILQKYGEKTEISRKGYCHMKRSMI